MLDRYQRCLETNNANEANEIIEEVVKLLTTVCARADDLVDYASEAATSNNCSRSLPALIVAAFLFHKLNGPVAVTKCIRIMFLTLRHEIVEKRGSKRLWREHLVFFMRKIALKSMHGFLRTDGRRDRRSAIDCLDFLKRSEALTDERPVLRTKTNCYIILWKCRPYLLIFMMFLIICASVAFFTFTLN